MAITPQDIFERGAEEAKGIFQALPGVAGDAAAAYVRNGTPSGPIPNVGVELARGACRRYGANPDAYSGRVASGFERVCRPYLDANGFGSAPTVGGALPGGCAGISYNFYRESRVTNGPWTENAAIVIFGPVTARNITQISSGPVNTQWSVTGRNSGGAPLVATATNGVTRANARWGRVTTNPPGGDPYLCTTDPVTGTPAVPDPTPQPPRFPITVAPSIDIDVDIDIGPGGDIVITAPGINVEVNPFEDLPGGGEGGDNPGIDQPGTSPASGVPPGDIGSPATPVVTGPGGLAAGEAPPNSVLVGVRVNILEPLPPVNQYDPDVLRGVCYVYMGVPGNLALEPSGVAMRNGQFCLAPVDFLTSWEVRANVNFMLRVTPYYRILELQEV